ISFLKKLLPDKIDLKECEIYFAGSSTIDMAQLFGKDKPKAIKSTSNLKDGFIIKSNKVEYHCSLHLYLEKNRNKYEKNISNILFGETT
ncbi:MAG: hypothetical protein ABIA63_07610, partial [bacterium]